jgi:hypothetical protein
MKTLTVLSVAYVALAAAAPFAQAHADSAEAMCEVRKDGDTYSLAPGNKSGHYKDQKGNKVVRTRSGNAEEFKWEGGRKILVTSVSAPNAHHQGGPNYQAGETAHDLADLVGAKAGQAEGELERRGYSYATGSTSGNAKYSSWYNRATHRCVMIRTEDGRYQSIVQTSPVDCGR